MKNVIYEDDYLIGSKENIWKFFKEEFCRQLQDNTIDFEELKNNFDEILELMRKIQENDDIYGNTLLKIKEQAMGGFTYSILKECDYDE